MAAIQWDYKLLAIAHPIPSSEKRNEAALKEAGSEGWEACATLASHGYTNAVLLKRPLSAG